MDPTAYTLPHSFLQLLVDWDFDFSTVKYTLTLHGEGFGGKDHSKGHPLSAKCLSHWLCGPISEACLSSGTDPLEGIGVHSTQGISSYIALHRRKKVADICAAATWSFSCSFLRF